jgi:hypothetical protein
MNKIKNSKAGIIFAVLGLVFLYMDYMTRMDHMGHGDMCGSTSHGSNLLGIGEMTWMWFTMAFVHFFIKDCNCSSCNKV